MPRGDPDGECGGPRARRERNAAAPAGPELRRGPRWRDEEDVRAEPRLPEAAPRGRPLDSADQHPPGAARAAGVRADRTVSRIPAVQGGGPNRRRSRDAATRRPGGDDPSGRLLGVARWPRGLRPTNRDVPDPRRSALRCAAQPIRRCARHEPWPTLADGGRVPARCEPRTVRGALRTPRDRGEASCPHRPSEAVRLVSRVRRLPRRSRSGGPRRAIPSPRSLVPAGRAVRSAETEKLTLFKVNSEGQPLDRRRSLSAHLVHVGPRKAQGTRPRIGEVRHRDGLRQPHRGHGRVRQARARPPAPRRSLRPLLRRRQGRAEVDPRCGRAGLLDVRRHPHERRDGACETRCHDRHAPADVRQDAARVRRVVPRALIPGDRERRHAVPRRRRRLPRPARVLSPRFAGRVSTRGREADPPGARARGRGDGALKRVHGHEGHAARPLKALISLDEAIRIAVDLVRPTERTETVPLADALRRVAAKDVRSAIDVPLADRAAMDGYAVRAQDTARVGDRVSVHASVEPGENVSRRGSDIERGSTVVRAGEVLTPAKVGALAAIGHARARVYAKPRVSILVTGDEVVPLGRSIRAGQVYDVNSHTIAAVVRENGGEPKPEGRAPDRLPTLRIALKKAAANDLVVVSGGSSVGEKDLVVEALESMGDLLFHGVAVKPGRPTALGLVDRKAVLGLPGNPTSCLSNGYVILAPMLRRIARLPPARGIVIEVPLAMRLASKIGRVELHTVRIVDGEAQPAYKESGAITSMAHADGYIEIPADVDGIEKGEIVRVVLF